MGRLMADPKRCTKCDVEKPRADFYPHAVAKNGVSAWCRDCTNTTTKQTQKTNPERARLASKKSRLKVKWGLSVDAFQKILEDQGGGCAICKTKTPGGRGRFAVDHCHSTGRIRGLLCHLCNLGIGALQDNTNNMREAIKYLEKEEHHGIAS